MTIEAPPMVEAVQDYVTEPRVRRIPEWVKRSLTLMAFLALFAVYAIWLGSTFFNTDARMLDIHQNAPILLLGLSVVVTLIAGQFDLSVGSMTTLTAFLSIGLTTRQDWPLWLGLVACLTVGVAGGLLNGLLVVKLQVNTFIATLATMGVLAGLARVYAGGAAVTRSDPEAKNDLPDWFTGPDSFGAFGAKVPAVVVWIVLVLVLGYVVWRTVHGVRAASDSRHRALAALGGGLAAALVVVSGVLLSDAISWTIGVLMVIAFALWITMERMTTGRHLRAIGQNATAARLAGVRTDAEVMKAFVIGGVLAAAAGVFLAANLGSAQPNVGAGFLLPAFTAAFISTVLLSSGRFTVWGTVAGGILLVYVAQGLVVGGLDFTWTEVVNGVVLAIAVALSTIFRRA